jgi:hypothetical protein|nr:MAG TPA: hypothetical protein [Caudoviricetes sp.]
MTKFMHLKEMARAIQGRFGGAPVIDVVNSAVVFRDSVITVQLCASRFSECLWVVDIPGGYHTFRRTDEALDVMASIYSYSLV